MTDAPRPAAPSRPAYEDARAFAEATPAIGALLGLDLGSKTIGVAACDAFRQIASGVETIARKKFGVDAARLEALAAERQAVGWVIGLPRNMDGTEGPRAQSTRAFARNLAARSPLPIMLWDERMSTQAVERTLLEADASRARRAQVVDKMAAAYILQGLLDRLSHLGRDHD
ncbi:MAG: Holliday junction resolvase RuvX [Pseudomonadota bacterium]